MAAQDIVNAIVIRGGGVAMLRPLTPDSGQITGAGTDIDFAAVVDTEIVIVFPDEASAQEYIEILLDHGITVEFVKLNTVVDGADGTAKSGGGGGGSLDKASMTIAEADLAMISAIKGLKGKRLRLSLPLGEAAGNVNANTGWAHLCCKLSGDISRKTGGENVVTVPLSFAGTAITADTAGDTALAAAGSAITPLEGTALTPPAITDTTTFKKGELVIE